MRIDHAMRASCATAALALTLLGASPLVGAEPTPNTPPQSSIEHVGTGLAGEALYIAASAGLATHTFTLEAHEALALTEHLAGIYHYQDLRRRISSRHWIFPTIRHIGGVVTRQGFELDLKTPDKEARLLPTLSLSTVGARVRIRF